MQAANKVKIAFGIMCGHATHWRRSKNIAGVTFGPAPYTLSFTIFTFYLLLLAPQPLRVNFVVVTAFYHSRLTDPNQIEGSVDMVKSEWVFHKSNHFSCLWNEDKMQVIWCVRDTVVSQPLTFGWPHALHRVFPYLQLLVNLRQL